MSVLPEEYNVVLFDSTNHAIRAEKVAKKEGLKVKLIPVPRHLSSDCGTALRFLIEDNPAITQVFEQKKVPYSNILPLKK